jgi:alpha-tubulin suppressor-like RCC1 family protein
VKGFDLIMMRVCRWFRLTIVFIVLVGGLMGCAVEPREPAELGRASNALSSSAALELKVLTNSCGANQAQDSFQITNNAATPIPLSSLSIKLWLNDTSGQTVVPHVWTGGCISASGNPSCVQQVSGVSVQATPFSPACGSDASHQANWEITISNSDGATLAPGATWSNLRASLNLTNFSNFSPGTSSWYSSCLSGTSYAASSYFAVYAGGNLVSASTGVPPVCRAARGAQRLSGELPAGIGDPTLVGPLPSSTTIALVIGLPLRNQAAIPAALAALSDPSSPSYRQYLTPQTFAATYGPTQADYDALTNFVKANGLGVVQTYTSRDQLLVSGSAANVERAFFVTLNQYRQADGRIFFAPANEPSLNLNVPLLHIAGLSNDGTARRSNGGGGTGPAGFCSPNTAGGSFAGADFRNAYLPSCSTLDGTGQIIGLFEMSDFYSADVNQYASTFGLPAPNVLRVSAGAALPALQALTAACPGFTGVISQPASCRAAAAAIPNSDARAANAGGEGEVALDIEMLNALAPGAQIRSYERATGSVATDALAILGAIANEPAATRPTVVSSSWSWLSSVPDPTVANCFVQLAFQGQSFFLASGDSGAYTPGGSLPVPWAPLISTSLITVVGGTELATTGNGASTIYSSETTWNDTPATAGCSITSCDQYGHCGCNSVGSGGLCRGFTVCAGTNPWTYQPVSAAGSAGCASAAYQPLPLPSYQAGLPAYLSSAANGLGQLSTSVRMLPDVSMVADQLAVFQALYLASTATTGKTYGPLEICSGGTSAAAPLWAAVATLANQALALKSQPPIGFANPSLYELATASLSSYAAPTGSFNDVASGSNVYTGNSISSADYQSVTGFDMATGLGSPTCNLLTHLSNPSHVAVSVSQGGTTPCAVASNGQVFCWGLDNLGQLGRPATSSCLGGEPCSMVPGAVPLLTSSVTQVSTDGAYVCALTAAGAVQCWGDNTNGQLGNGTTTSSTTPVQVVGLTSGVTSISTGGGTACAVTGSGGVVCWGQNVLGQLGNGTTASSTVPVGVTGLSSGMKSVSVGIGFACATSQSGAAFCWGSNELGQLGNGGVSADICLGVVPCSTTPVGVTGLSSGVSAVVVPDGDEFACALKLDGSVVCWGIDTIGQLGDGGTPPDFCNPASAGPAGPCALTPVPVSGLSGVTALATGIEAACAVTSGGSAVCWGELFGTGQSSVPVLMPGLASGISNVTVGSSSACFLTTAGAILCLGDNIFGELGNNSTTYSGVPVPVVSFP